MILPNKSKKTCYYSIGTIGAASLDPMRREFGAYYTAPPGLGLGEVQEIDLPPLDGNTETSNIVGQYVGKFIQVNGEYEGKDAKDLFSLSTVLWKFADYDKAITVYEGGGFDPSTGLIDLTEETFTLSLKHDYLKVSTDDDGKLLVDSSVERSLRYALPFTIAGPSGFGYDMNVGTAVSNYLAEQSGETDNELTLQEVIDLVESQPGDALRITSKEDAPFIEDYAFEYHTPYTKDAIVKANIQGKAMDADIKFRYHYYLKDYEDAVNALSDVNTSVSDAVALSSAGDRVEFMLPSPYEYEYSNFVLDNPYYSKVTVGGGDEKVSPISDTTKNVINSIQVFEELYGADYVDFTSLAGKISFSLIRDGAIVDYLREWSKAAKFYQELGAKDEASNKHSQVAKNRKRFLAESALIGTENVGNTGLSLPNMPTAPDSLNSLLNNATFDYFNFNHPDIEKYFGDLDFTLRNSLNIGQKNTKILNTAASFPMSVEIKFKYPVLSLFHPLAQRTKEWLPSKVESNGGEGILETHGGLMQKVMATNLADPFMRYVVDTIDITSGGPTPINEEYSDPTILSQENKNPNFVRQAKILGKDQFGYRTNNVKLHSADLAEVQQRMAIDAGNGALDAGRRTSKTFFSDRAEDFFLPTEKIMDALQLSLTVKNHKKAYEDVGETAKGEPFRRDFKSILEGKKCFVETLFFGIEKYEVTRDERGRHKPIDRSNSVQRFFVTPPPLAGNGNTDEYVRYVDTQVKFGKKYSYQVFAYVLAYGTEYRCKSVDETANIEGVKGSGGVAAFLSVPALRMTYESRPGYKIFKVPYYGTDWEDKGGVFFPTHIKDNPPTAPYMNVIPYKNVNNKVLINLQPSSGDVYQFPISIREDENFSYENDPSDIYFENAPPGMIRFSSDDRIKKYRIYRLDTEPMAYGDFKDATIFEINTSEGSSLKDTIRPNTKYYYTAKSVDAHDQFSNPTPVYSVEIVDEKGLIYSIIEEHEIKIPTKKTRNKSGRKALYIAPNLEQIKMSNSDIENPQLGLRDKSIFSKRFKVRLTSKKTNKMVDFNVRFTQENENKKILDKTYLPTKEFLPRYASINPDEYSWVMDGPDYDLALMLSIESEYDGEEVQGAVEDKTTEEYDKVPPKVKLTPAPGAIGGKGKPKGASKPKKSPGQQGQGRQGRKGY
jgi:hypothetical protein